MNYLMVTLCLSETYDINFHDVLYTFNLSILALLLLLYNSIISVFQHGERYET